MAIVKFPRLKSLWPSILGDIKQDKLAEMCEVTQQAVNKWLQGYGRPAPEILARLIITLNLTADQVDQLIHAGDYNKKVVLFHLEDEYVPSEFSNDVDILIRGIRDAIGQGNSKLAREELQRLDVVLKSKQLSLAESFHNLGEPDRGWGRRRSEEQKVLRALSSRWPVIILEGAQGTGKSTLAIQVGYFCLPGDQNKITPPFQAVVWVSAKDQPEKKRWLNEILDEVAVTLNYQYIKNRSTEAEKSRALRPRLRTYRTLIIIDNFETIQDPDLEDWIQDVPEPSKVLLTSIPTGFRPAKPVPIEGVAQQEGTALIDSHTQRIGLHEMKNTINASVAALIDATGGNPKLMQLLIGVLTSQEQEPDDLIKLLKPIREATLLYAILLPKTWNALSKDAAHVLLVIPFFVESASEAALSAASGVAEDKLAQALLQLFKLSLLDMNVSGQRHGVHPVVRAFATEQWKDFQGFEREARLRWCTYYVNYVEEYGDNDLGEPVGGGKPGARDKLREEITNIRQVIDWCLIHDQVKAVRIVERITTFLLDEGDWNIRLQLIQLALDTAKTHGMYESQVGLMIRKGWTLLVTGYWEQAQVTYKEANDLARQHNVLYRLVQGIRDLGDLYAIRGAEERENKREAEAVYYFAQAKQQHAESLELAVQIDDKFGILEARSFDARAAYLCGDTEIAEHRILELLKECQAANQWRNVLFFLRYLCNIAIAKGDLEQAEKHLKDVKETLQSKYYEAHEKALGLESEGDIKRIQGRLADAQETYKKALDCAIGLGMNREEERIKRKIREL